MEALAALSLISVALLLLIISLSTEFWAEGHRILIPGLDTHCPNLKDAPMFVHQGLWTFCTCKKSTWGSCSCEPINNLPNSPSWYIVAQISMCIAFLANCTAAVILFLEKFKYPGTFTNTSSIVVTLAAMSNSVGVLAFALEERHWDFAVPLSWSWGLASFAMVLEVIALISTMIKSPDYPDEWK